LSDITSEARFISNRIKALKDSIPEYHYGHTAVLYRTNFQSRSIEEELIRQTVPYRIIGGVGYYERKEVKDLVSYLRLIGNPNDDFSLERIINVPRPLSSHFRAGKHSNFCILHV
jgi:DNA helicase II / ATP-dependent DNA helicase PcrA